MIVLVVNMHACVTYSHVGSWYVNEQPEPGMPVKLAFAFWQGHLQAFFMGLLFFLVITPISLLSRLLKMDPLRLSADAASHTPTMLGSAPELVRVAQ